MGQPWREQYGGYVIDGAPHRTRTGVYEACLRLRRLGAPKLKARTTVFPDVAPFLSADDAARFAITYGRHWIDAGIHEKDWPDSVIDANSLGCNWQDTQPPQ